MRVLLAEDDVDDALMAKRALSPANGFEVVHVRTGGEALAAAERAEFDVCLLDYRLPDRTGISLCRDLRSRSIKTPIFLVTSIRSDTVAAQAIAAGAQDCIVKGNDYGDRLLAELRTRLGAHA